MLLENKILSSQEESKQSLAKAPSRKGREVQVSYFLCELAPWREHVFAAKVRTEESENTIAGIIREGY